MSDEAPGYFCSSQEDNLFSNIQYSEKVDTVEEPAKSQPKVCDHPINPTAFFEDLNNIPLFSPVASPIDSSIFDGQAISNSDVSNALPRLRFPTIAVPPSLTTGIFSDSQESQRAFLLEHLNDPSPQNHHINTDVFYPSPAQVSEIRGTLQISTAYEQSVANVLNGMQYFLQPNIYLSKKEVIETVPVASASISRPAANATKSTSIKPKNSKLKKVVDVTDEDYSTYLTAMKKSLPDIGILLRKLFKISVGQLQRAKEIVQKETHKTEKVQLTRQKNKLLELIFNDALGCAKTLLKTNCHAKKDKEKEAFQEIYNALQENRLVQYFDTETDSFLRKQCLVILIQLYFIGKYRYSVDSFSTGAFYTNQFQAKKSHKLILKSTPKRMNIVLNSEGFSGHSVSADMPAIITINGHPTLCTIEGNKNQKRKHWVFGFDMEQTNQTAKIELEFGTIKEKFIYPDHTTSNASSIVAATTSTAPTVEQMEQDDEEIDLNFPDDE